MHCDLSDSMPWSAFLQARQLLTTDAPSIQFVRRGSWTCEPATSPTARAGADALLVEVDQGSVTSAASQGAAVYRTCPAGLPELDVPAGISLDPGMATAARVYLPILLGAARARRAGESFVAGHVTQTLDGRIACENGQSQWIGNAADQHHSHRMRALLDGVMVGATTALQDDPKLTVRHVDGSDPRRVVVSGRGRFLTEGRDLALMAAPGCELFVDASLPTRTSTDSIFVHRVDAKEGRLEPAAILAALRDRGIHSIYLEGGAGVLSSFLHARAIDLLQVHIASMILGAGLPSLSLPAVEHVDDGMHVHMDHAILDGHVLLTCRPRS